MVCSVVFYCQTALLAVVIMSKQLSLFGFVNRGIIIYFMFLMYYL